MSGDPGPRSRTGTHQRMSFLKENDSLPSHNGLGGHEEGRALTFGCVSLQTFVQWPQFSLSKPASDGEMVTTVGPFELSFAMISLI